MTDLRIEDVLVIENEEACDLAAELADLTGEGFTSRGRYSLRDAVPDLAVPVAEPGECAERFGVGQGQCRPVDFLRLGGVGLAAGGLPAIKADLGVGAVAERLSSRLAATAQKV